MDIGKHGIDFSNADENERYQRLHEFQSEFTSPEFTNWREEQQALNIIETLRSLPANSPILVWCGNSHHAKMIIQEWLPMGYQFKKHSNINPFVIDQIRTVKVDGIDTSWYEEFVIPACELLEQMSGTAGFLAEEAPEMLRDNPSEDAFLLSAENELE